MSPSILNESSNRHDLLISGAISDISAVSAASAVRASVGVLSW